MSEAAFVAAKCGRVVITSPIAMDGWVGNVQHLVKEDVVYYKSRDDFRIEGAAYRDSIVRRIVMTKNVIALSRRPCKHGFFETAAKVPEIQGIKNFVEIVNISF